MESWDELTTVEKVLVRRAVSNYGLRGAAAHVVAVLRWAGSPQVPALRGPTEDEQRMWVPELGAALLRLVETGWLTVHRSAGMSKADDPPLPEAESARLAAAPEQWLWGNSDDFALSVRATPEGSARWPGRATAPDRGGWTEDEERVWVCAMEASGWLTGPFGIFEDLPPELTGAERRAFVTEQLAPLIAFVAAGEIEVHHVAKGPGPSTVIPLDGLVEAFCDRELRYDDGEEWGIGFTCCLVQSLADGLR